MSVFEVQKSIKSPIEGRRRTSSNQVHLESMKSSKSFVFKVSFMISFSLCCLDQSTESFESFDIIFAAKCWLLVWSVTSGARRSGGIIVTIFVAILCYENLIAKLSIPCTTIWRMIIDVHACTELKWQRVVVHEAMQVRKLMQMGPSYNDSNVKCFWNDWENIHFCCETQTFAVGIFRVLEDKMLRFYMLNQKRMWRHHRVSLGRHEQPIMRKSSW